MKRITLYIIAALLLCFLQAKAQLSTDQITEKYGITAKWALEADGCLSFSKVVTATDTAMTKDAIYDKVQSYFSYTYKDGKNVIQVADKEAGYIIGKGIYPLISDTYKTIFTEHIVKVECRDGKARIIITVCDYDEDGMAIPADAFGHKRTVRISSTYPFTKFNKRTEKLTKDEKLHDEVFATLIGLMDAVFGDIERTINSGSSVLESEDW